MYYDHFLATNWSDYTNVLLETFVSETYQTLQTYASLMPERSQRTLYYMQRSNWLVGYATFDGLGRALSGLASRTRFVSHMEQAICDLRLDYPAYAQDFSAFFPDLIRFSHRKLPQLRTSNLHSWPIIQSVINCIENIKLRLVTDSLPTLAEIKLIKGWWLSLQS